MKLIVKITVGPFCFALGGFLLNPLPTLAFEKPLAVFGQVEYWNSGNAQEGTVDAFNSGLSEARSLGVTTSLGTDISAGYGGRIGVMANKLVKGFGIGLSLGYVQGPEGKFDYYSDPYVVGPTHYSGVNGSYESKLHYARALIEAQKSFPMKSKIEFRIRGGAGLARGNVSNKWSQVYFGSSTGSESGSSDKSWTGFTWEIGPSVAIKIPNAVLDVGVIFAGFPSLSGDANVPEVKWMPWGLRAGVEF